MARKRNKRTVLPVSLDSDLYDRAKAAAEVEAERLKISNYGLSSLARQAIQLRVEQIEAEASAA